MCFICDLKTPSAHTAPDAPDQKTPRWQARRAFMLAAGATAAGSALAQVDVGSSSGLRKLVPAETLETSARQQYTQVLAEARAWRDQAAAMLDEARRAAAAVTDDQAKAVAQAISPPNA